MLLWELPTPLNMWARANGFFSDKKLLIFHTTQIFSFPVFIHPLWAIWWLETADKRVLGSALVLANNPSVELSKQKLLSCIALLLYCIILPGAPAEMCPSHWRRSRYSITTFESLKDPGSTPSSHIPSSSVCWEMVFSKAKTVCSL